MSVSFIALAGCVQTASSQRGSSCHLSNRLSLLLLMGRRNREKKKPVTSCTFFIASCGACVYLALAHCWVPILWAIYFSFFLFFLIFQLVYLKKEKNRTLLNWDKDNSLIPHKGYLDCCLCERCISHYEIGTKSCTVYFRMSGYWDLDECSPFMCMHTYTHTHNRVFWNSSGYTSSSSHLKKTY